MKKWTWISLILIAALMLSGCTMMNRQQRLEDAVGVELPKGEELYHKDTHGGFQGDGLETFVMQYDESVLPTLMSAGWKELPLSENMQLLLYGRDGEGSFLPYEADFELPQIENGRWFFLDRHPDCTDPYDDSPVYERASYNFTAAIFDADTGRMYYFRFDT